MASFSANVIGREPASSLMAEKLSLKALAREGYRKDLPAAVSLESNGQ